MPELSPLQAALMQDEAFIGRITVILAKYATDGLKTLPPTTGNTSNGSKVITNIGNVAGMVIGQEVAIAGVPAQPSYIVSIDSLTQITLNIAAQATAVGVVVQVKPFPTTGERGTTFNYAKLVSANARVYALQWMPYIVRSTNVAGTISWDATAGRPVSSATDLQLESQVITDFLARSL